MHGRSAAFAALHAVIQADRGGTHGRVLSRQRDDVFGGNPGERRHAFRRMIPRLLAKLFEADGVALDVIGVVEILGDQHVHQAECERRVAAGIDREVLVGELRGPVAVRVDHVELRAIAPRFDDERPQMHVGPENIRAPGDDEFRMPELFGLRAESVAKRRRHPSHAGG